MVKGKSVGGAVGVFGKGSNGSEEAGKETIYMDCDLKSYFLVLVLVILLQNPTWFLTRLPWRILRFLRIAGMEILQGMFVIWLSAPFQF